MHKENENVIEKYVHKYLGEKVPIWFFIPAASIINKIDLIWNIYGMTW